MGRPLSTKSRSRFDHDACFLIAFVLLAPLAWAPGLSFHFDAAPKAVALQLLAAVLLCQPGRLLHRLTALYARPAGTLLLLLCGLYALTLLIATAFSENPALSLYGSGWRRFGALSQLAVLLCGLYSAACFTFDTRYLRLALRALCLAGLLTAAYAVCQAMGLDPFLDASLYALPPPAKTLRPPSTLGHAAYLGSFLVVVAFLGIAAQSLETSKFWRTLCLASVALSAAGIAVSGTRAVLGGLLLGALVLVLSKKGSAAVLFRQRTLLWTAATTASIALALRLSPAWAPMVSRAKEWTLDLSGGTRLPLWLDTLSLIGRRWPIGWGPETFPAVFPLYQSLRLSQLYPDFYHESPHSVWLDAAASNGLASLLCLLALFLAGFYCSFRARRLGLLPACLSAALLALAVTHSFFVFTLPSLCCLMLILAAQSSLAASPAQTAPTLSPFWKPAAALAGLALAICALSVAWTDSAYQRIQSHLNAGNWQPAIEWHAKAQPWPASPAPELWYSQRMTKLASLPNPEATRMVIWKEAVDSSRLALSRPGEDVNLAYYNAGVLAVLAQNGPQAESDLRQAIQRAPNWYQPRWLLCRILAQTNRPAEARPQCSQALTQLGDQHEDLRKLITQTLEAQH
ncbi:O-antigen ligase family protein [Paludibaculum fermentans]|uniref:O-antigen ligase family protein n=1 Tax=Paludibaculum fermentans TaxID=1473598 RepID=A0A7S7NKX3_PALFE|nr:O-antigen ligase family protein [Paludibaculum fermentans]QOY85440.1 O-antigen ligase family protein [Paludibaculum fermentans]